MANSLPTEVTVLTDVNILAIGLTRDHPAHDHVSPWLQQVLDGPNVLLLSDYYPLRAQYLMTNKFGVNTVTARNAIQSLVRSPARIVSATETTLLEAYEISAEQTHDVYDSFIKNKENTRAFRRGMNPTTHSTVHR